MNQDSTSPVAVDLSSSRSASRFEAQASFFLKELGRALELIYEHFIDLSPPRLSTAMALPEDELALRHRHESIFIYGGRGTGKTSFLLTMMGAVRQPGKEYPLPKVQRGLEATTVFEAIEVLDNIDPSRIEGEEIFLSTVVAHVLRAVRKRLEAQQRIDDIDRLGPSLRRVGRGLRVLVPNAKQGIWGKAMQDPDLFAEMALQDAESGLTLGEDVALFLANSAALLNVRGFLLPLDDVDTALDQGWQVLETLRRYLDTRRLLVVMSGDLALYRSVVRRQQWQHFKSLVEVEDKVAHTVNDAKTNIGRYYQQVEQLERQYLHKLLLAPNRIGLRSVRERIWAGEIRLARMTVRRAQASDPRSLRELLESLSTKLFARPDKTQVDPLARSSSYAWLVPQNTRLFIQFLEIVVSHNHDRELVSELVKLYDEELNDLRISKALREAMFLGEGLGALARWMVERVWEVADIERLDPATVQEHEHAARWSVGLLLLQAIWNTVHRRKFGASLRYLGKVIRPVMHAPNAIDYSGAGEGSDFFTPESYATVLRLGNNESAWLTTSRVRASRKLLDRSIAPGALRLVGDRHSTPKRKGVLAAISRTPKGKYAKQAIDPWLTWLHEHDSVVTDKVDSDQLPNWASVNHRTRSQLLPAVVGIFRVSYLDYGTVHTYLDAWKGFAALSDASDPQQLSELVAESSERLLPVWESNAPNQDDDEGGDVEIDEQTDVDTDDPQHPSDPFPCAWTQWCNLFVSDNELPPSATARLSSLLWTSLEKQTNDISSTQTTSAGKTLELWTLAFLQASLIAEVEWRTGRPALTQGYNVNSVRSTGSVDTKSIRNRNPLFQNTWQHRQATEENSELKLPFTTRWACCPILLATLSLKVRTHILDWVKRCIMSDNEFSTFIDSLPEKDFFNVGYGRTSALRNEHKIDIHDLLCALIAPPRQRPGKDKGYNIEHDELFPKPFSWMKEK